MGGVKFRFDSQWNFVIVGYYFVVHNAFGLIS